MILALKIIPITDEFQLFWPSGPQQLLQRWKPPRVRPSGPDAKPLKYNKLIISNDSGPQITDYFSGPGPADKHPSLGPI